LYNRTNCHGGGVFRRGRHACKRWYRGWGDFAATIWVLAAIGVAIDIAGELSAIKVSVLVVGILYGVDVLEDYFTSFTQGVHTKFHDWKKRKKQPVTFYVL
jgi:uncharacterized membrane protein YhiD involved in acid resistance